MLGAAWFAALVACGGCGQNGDGSAESTPRSAAAAFAAAVERGDRDAAVAASTGADPAVVGDLAAAVGGIQRVKRSAAARYGEAGRRVVDPSRDLDLVHKPEDADERVEGDRAALTPKAGGTPLRLKRVDGAWKVDMTELAGSNAQSAVPMFRAMASAAHATADEIEAGKHPTADEASRAMAANASAALFGKPVTREAK